MKDPYRIVIQPLLTERSTLIRDVQKKYLFWVDKSANKIEIKEAIEKIFSGIKVISVNTLIVRGKPTRIVRGNRKGKKADWKKAIITLRPEDKIEIYEGI